MIAISKQCKFVFDIKWYINFAISVGKITNQQMYLKAYETND